jgi:hypothetical protein
MFFHQSIVAKTAKNHNSDLEGCRSSSEGPKCVCHSMAISFGTRSGSGLFLGFFGGEKYHNITHSFIKNAISRGTSAKLFFSKFTPQGVNFFSCIQFWAKKCVRMFTPKN